MYFTLIVHSDILLIVLLSSFLPFEMLRSFQIMIQLPLLVNILKSL
jgi:hypothetical protein